MIKNIFSSNKKWGLIFLMFTIVIVFITYLIIDRRSSHKSEAIFQDVTDEWLQSRSQDVTEGPSERQRPITRTPDPPPYSPTYFDPNTASEKVMLANGVPPHSVKRIIAYRNKGGKFYQKEKLLNFGISDEQYKTISPYVKIAEPTQHSRTYSDNHLNDQPNQEPKGLEINSATQEQLMQFRGIGHGYSRRIIDYRNKLGGFLSVEQLKEVYGFPDSVYNHIKNKLVINDNNIKKININTSTLEELSLHPYIRKHMAENILKLRNDIKEFRSVQDLRQIPLINEEKYRKLVPYITL